MFVAGWHIPDLTRIARGAHILAGIGQEAPRYAFGRFANRADSVEARPACTWFENIFCASLCYSILVPMLLRRVVRTLRFAKRTPADKAGPLPFAAWGTKGFEFWTFLSVFLREVRPKAILELGCGRSSTFFADYAHAHAARYVGIENNLRWFNKTTLDIDLLGFGRRHVAHVELAADGSWYDRAAFDAAIGDLGPFDFALIDAPNERRFFDSAAGVAQFFRTRDGNPFGHRDDPAGLEAIKSATSHCDVMMVDDVHKEHVFRSVDRMLAKPHSYEKYYFIYYPARAMANALCISVLRGSAAASRLPAIVELLGFSLQRDYVPQPGQA